MNRRYFMKTFERNHFSNEFVSFMNDLIRISIVPVKLYQLTIGLIHGVALKTHFLSRSAEAF